MAHPEECARVELHRTAARPSFSIIAVPHMVLYGCPSSCPIAEHMLVPERGFYSAFRLQTEVHNVHLKKQITLFDVDRGKRCLLSPCAILRPINRIPVWKHMLVPTGFGSTRGLGPFDLSLTKDWIILETLVYVIAPSLGGWNEREKEINEKRKWQTDNVHHPCEILICSQGWPSLHYALTSKKRRKKDSSPCAITRAFGVLVDVWMCACVRICLHVCMSYLWVHLRHWAAGYAALKGCVSAAIPLSRSLCFLAHIQPPLFCLRVCIIHHLRPVCLYSIIDALS